MTETVDCVVYNLYLSKRNINAFATCIEGEMHLGTFLSMEGAVAKAEAFSKAPLLFVWGLKSDAVYIPATGFGKWWAVYAIADAEVIVMQITRRTIR